MLALPLPITVIASDVDESTPAGWPPARIVEELALRKAGAVRGLLAADRDLADGAEAPLVIGSDTIVVLEGAVMGKPRDADDAAAMLTALQGRTHQVYTGVAVVRADNGRTSVRHRVTDVVMKPLDAGRIGRYIASGEPFDKAGSYGIQGIGSTLVESIHGCYFTVVGLPLSLLADMLSEHGVEVP